MWRSLTTDRRAATATSCMCTTTVSHSRTTLVHHPAPSGAAAQTCRSTAAYVTIGAPVTLTSTSFVDMRMSDWGIWDNVVLTTQDVTNLYNAGAAARFPRCLEVPQIRLLVVAKTFPRQRHIGASTVHRAPRLDSSGNGYHLSPIRATSLLPSPKQYVETWTDKSGVLGAFYAGDGPAASFQAKAHPRARISPRRLGPGTARR